MSTAIIEPVGLQSLKTALKQICEDKRDAYIHCGIQPPHFIMNLSAGEGQRVAVQYVSDMMKGSGVRHFGGLDDYLLFTCNSSISGLNRIRAQITSSAIYTNGYEGIIGLDVSAVAPAVNEEPAVKLCDLIAEMEQTATMVIMVSSTPSRNELQLIQKIEKTLSGVERIDLAPYSECELRQAVVQLLYDHGIEMADEDKCQDELLRVIKENEIVRMKDAVVLGKNLLFSVRYDCTPPLLSSEALLRFTAKASSKAERSRS